MGKTKHEDTMMIVPCPKLRCSFRSTVMYDFGFKEMKDEEKMFAVQRTLSSLLRSHEDGKHNAECCHCCHRCTCEHYACRELAK